MFQAAMDRASLRALAGRRGYRSFLAAATLARVADEMFSVGVVLLVLDRTGSAALAGATVAAVTLPSLVTGPLLGARMDLTGRRRALMIADGALMIATIAGIALLAGRGPDVLVPLVALLGGLTWPLSFGGFTSLIEPIAGAELVAPANALEASSLNSALVLGPALAGTLSAGVDPLAPLLVEIALTAAAVALIARVPGLDAPRERDGRTLIGVAVSGVVLLARSPALRGVTAAGSIGLAGLGLLVVAFPFFAEEHLGVQRGAAGYLWAAFAVGSMAGALALVRLQHRFPPERIVLGSLAAFGALMLLWPLQSSFALMLAVVAVAGFADGPGLAATFATRQRHVPPPLRGQVFTTAVGFKVGALALGSAVGGPVVVAIGSEATLLAGALVQFAAVAAGAALMASRRGRIAAPARE
jgi:MFS family permease